MKGKNELCGYCYACRGKEIMCKDGKHEISHFGVIYRFYCWSGLSRLYMKWWLFGIKQLLYKYNIL